jgi:acetyltransferase-like isoleucine patch superfamily enzyme
MQSTPEGFEISDTAQIDPSVKFGPNCKNISIGHGVVLRRDIYIDVETLSIGDYVTIHHGVVIHGMNVSIGHNCWVGHYSILDAHGGELRIGNNVGIGAQSQLWSHMKFGDTLAGCNWRSEGKLIIGDDAWLVGHCIVSPIVIQPRAMLLVGSVATKDLLENHIYAGTPAKDVSETLGQQFLERSKNEIESDWNSLVCEYEDLGNDVAFIRTVETVEGLERSDSFSSFSPYERRYVPNYGYEETEFIRFLLYDKAKFLPFFETTQFWRIGIK